MQQGKFITFEGPEGSGKSTQGRLLVRYLQSRGYRAIFLREPGATALGEKIRRILLDKNSPRIYPLPEMLLYMAARAELVREAIRPALGKGYFVVCDRFVDSTLAYQGFGLGVNPRLIMHLADFVTEKITPDLTIFLDLLPKFGLKACGAKLDRIEERPLAYHQKVRRGYLKLAKQHPGRIKIVKPNKDKKITQEKIRNIIEKYIL